MKYFNFTKSRFLFFVFLLISTHSLYSQTAVATISSAPVENGSFDIPVLAPGTFQYAPSGSGWSFNSTAGISSYTSPFTNCNPSAPAGNQVLLLQRDGNANRTVSIATAGAYRISLKAAQRGCQNVQNQILQVYVDGSLIDEMTPTSIYYQTFTTPVLWLTAGNHNLHLQGVVSATDNTVFVDDVRWESIPRWSQTTTWQDGVLPSGSSMTTIPSGFIVAMDVTTCVSHMVHINGTLTAPLNANFTLSTKFIHVEGLLEIGREKGTYKANGKITLEGSNVNSTIGGEEMGAKGIAVMSGGRLELHGNYQIPWTQLGAQAWNGSYIITLKDDATTWKVGDKIVIASTDFDMNRAEERTITAINANKLTLNEGLAYKHYGQMQNYNSTSGNWNVDERAEVGLLSRNLVIEGDAANPELAFGGHIMIMQGGVAHVENIELNRMGQRAKLARYPFHWHLVGDASGQYFKNNSVHNTYNRAITIHGTNNATVNNNVCYDNYGHAIFIEDGTETGNIITGNLGLLTKRPVKPYALLSSDTTLSRNASGPSTFWITNPSNIVKNNRAAGSDGSGFWFAFHQKTGGGTDPNFQNIPTGYIDNNTAHSNVHGWLIGMAPITGNTNQVPDLNNDYRPSQPPFISGLTVYKNKLGVYSRIGGDSISSTYTNMIVADNWEGDANTWISEIKQSLWVGASLNYEAIPSGTSISSNDEGCVIGHILYDGPCRISDSHFAGFGNPKFSLFDQWGANIKYHGHSLKNTTLASGSYSIQFRNIQSPTWFNASITDLDGKFTGTPMSVISRNHDIMVDNAGHKVGVNGWESQRRFGYVEVRPSDEIYPWAPGQEHNKRQTSQLLRSDGKTWIEQKKEVEGVSLSLILNGVYQYKYLYHEQIPFSTRFDFYSMNAGEWVILEIPNVPSSAKVYLGTPTQYNGTNPSLYGGSNFIYIQPLTTLAALQAATGTTAAYVGTSMFIRYQAPAGNSFLNRGRIGSMFLCLYGDCAAGSNIKLNDADGDGATDIAETTGYPFFKRNPNDVTDMSFDFDNGDGGKWIHNAQIIDNIFAADQWVLKSSGTDAYITREGLFMDGSKIKYIDTRTLSQLSGQYEFTWKTVDQDYYDNFKKVTVNYTTPNDWKVIRFKLDDHALWKNKTITGIRIKPVCSSGTYGFFDWVKAKNTWIYDLNKTAAASTLQLFDGGGNGLKQTTSLINTVLNINDNTWSFDLTDWNNDGYTDIAAIKKQATGSGFTELHVLDGKKDYSEFLFQSATKLGYTNLNDHVFMADYNGDKKPDIWCIAHNGTGSGKTEVHIVDGNNLQSFLLNDATALDLVPNTINDFGVYDYDGDKKPDVWYIQKNGMSGKTEIHILKNTGDVSTMFDNFSAHIATTLPVTNANWSFDVADYNRDGFVDVIGIDRIGNADQKVHVYVLNGATSFQDYLLNVSAPQPSSTLSHTYMVDESTNATGLGYSGAFAPEIITNTSELKKSTGDVVVYPNPANDEVIIDLGKYGGDALELTINTINNGSVVFKKDYKQSDMLLKVSLENMNTGVYIIQLNFNGDVIKKKLVIAK